MSRRAKLTAVGIPLGLFLVAVAVRLWAAWQFQLPPTENSASYVGVARNLVEGRGLVSDAMWSYATPPLVFPKPAFEIWMPMGAFLAAVPMALLGTTFAAAQLSSVLVGAAVAPLAWLVALDAARRHGLDARRTTGVALTAGLATAVVAPLVMAAAAPDSTTPFTTLVVLAALVVPGALRGSVRHAAALGGVLSLAYLSRQETIWLAAAFMILLVPAIRRAAAAVPGGGRALTLRALAPTVVVGGLMTAPWWLRNLAAFGSITPSQAIENAWLTRNEEIFAYADRPDAATFLAQGPATIAGNIAAALGINLVDALLLPAAPLTLLGLIALPFLRRSPALRGASPLLVVLVSGALMFVATAVMFPIATRWGTFMHASGPAIVGLIVVAALGADAAVARVGRARGWATSNVVLPAVLLIGLAAPLTVLQITLLAGQTRATHDALTTAIADLARQPELADPRRPVITDRPIYLAEGARRPTLALPDESPGDVGRLADDFGAPLVLMLGERGRYPDAFADSGTGGVCFRERTATGPTNGTAPRHRIFVVLPGCGTR